MGGGSSITKLFSKRYTLPSCLKSKNPSMGGMMKRVARAAGKKRSLTVSEGDLVGGELEDEEHDPSLSVLVFVCLALGVLSVRFFLPSFLPSCVWSRLQPLVTVSVSNT